MILIHQTVPPIFGWGPSVFPYKPLWIHRFFGNGRSWNPGQKGDDRKGNPQTSNGHGHQNCRAGENLTSRKLDKWNNNHEWVDVFPITNGEFPAIAMLVFRGGLRTAKLTNTNTSSSPLVWPLISRKDWHGLRVTLKVLFSIDSSRSSHTWVICIKKNKIYIYVPENSRMSSKKGLLQ